MPQQPNPSEKAAATFHRSQITFCSACSPTLSWRTPPAQTSSLLSPSSAHAKLQKDRTLIKSTEALERAIWGSVALRQIGRKSVASRRSGASLSEARKPSFDHSLGVARFRSCSHQPPSTRARDLSGWLIASFQLGLSAAAAAAAARSTLVSFRSFPAPALLKSCRALKPAPTPPLYVHLTLSVTHPPPSQNPPLHPCT